VSSESNTSFGDRFKWTGQEFDSSTGLQYNQARYYDPKTGRWTSQDPLSFVAGDANPYRYVGNDTPNQTDPSGEGGSPPNFNQPTSSGTIQPPAQRAGASTSGPTRGAPWQYLGWWTDQNAPSAFSAPPATDQGTLASPSDAVDSLAQGP